MTFLSGMLAGLASVGAVIFAVITLMNPYNDLTRVYTLAAAVVLGVLAAVMWGVFLVLLRRLDPSD